MDFYSDPNYPEVKKISEDINFFHWDLEFPQIFYDTDGNKLKDGGFDVVIGNPPWQILKPDVDEFFSPLYDLVNTKKFSTLTKDKKNTFKKKSLKDEKCLISWNKYQDFYKKQMLFFNKSNIYEHQTSIVNGKMAASDINLYKLFVERSYQILKNKGYCGLVVPSGIYSDLGSKGLRNLLLKENKLHHLFAFINRKGIFEDVHRQFKFCIIVFEKNGSTKDFLSSFYMENAAVLEEYEKIAYRYDVEMIQTMSPDSLSFLECKNESEFKILQKLYKHHPMLGSDKWNFRAAREFDMANDSKLFHTTNIGFPLYEGKMINKFTHTFANPRYWIKQKEGSDVLRKKELNRMKRKNKNHTITPRISCNEYRLAWRTITNSTNERTLISTILPKNVFLGHSLNYLNSLNFDGTKYSRSISHYEIIFLCGIFNSFVVDFILRHKVSTNLTIFHLMDLPIPRYHMNNKFHQKIINDAAKLICVNDQYEELRKEIEIERVAIDISSLDLEAKINVNVAKIYNLTTYEFKHILSNFPIVNQN